jgi:transcriptional regulator with XRE-family HTH domain
MTRSKDWAADPLCPWLREQRNARRWSLTTAEEKTGVPAVVLGSYERGDRTPPPHMLRKLAAVYGFDLVVIPVGTQVPARAVETLRRLADELEQAQVGA